MSSWALGNTDRPFFCELIEKIINRLFEKWRQSLAAALDIVSSHCKHGDGGWRQLQTWDFMTNARKPAHTHVASVAVACHGSVGISLGGEHHLMGVDLNWEQLKQAVTEWQTTVKDQHECFWTWLEFERQNQAPGAKEEVKWRYYRTI